MRYIRYRDNISILAINASDNPELIPNQVNLIKDRRLVNLNQSTFTKQSSWVPASQSTSDVRILRAEPSRDTLSTYATEDGIYTSNLESDMMEAWAGLINFLDVVADSRAFIEGSSDTFLNGNLSAIGSIYYQVYADIHLDLNDLMSVWSVLGDGAGNIQGISYGEADTIVTRYAKADVTGGVDINSDSVMLYQASSNIHGSSIYVNAGVIVGDGCAVSISGSNIIADCSIQKAGSGLCTINVDIQCQSHNTSYNSLTIDGGGVSVVGGGAYHIGAGITFSNCSIEVYAVKLVTVSADINNEVTVTINPIVADAAAGVFISNVLSLNVNPYIIRMASAEVYVNCDSVAIWEPFHYYPIADVLGSASLECNPNTIIGRSRADVHCSGALMGAASSHSYGWDTYVNTASVVVDNAQQHMVEPFEAKAQALVDVWASKVFEGKASIDIDSGVVSISGVVGDGSASVINIGIISVASQVTFDTQLNSMKGSLTVDTQPIINHNTVSEMQGESYASIWVNMNFSCDADVDIDSGLISAGGVNATGVSILITLAESFASPLTILNGVAEHVTTCSIETWPVINAIWTDQYGPEWAAVQVISMGVGISGGQAVVTANPD